ncbi:hypothetical protein AB0E01_02205 [Nocardia vinacea]|uniref:hypothetical protein n=1 Tax=Nocardia vinacea TaxID=96468 RepID=UPI0033DB52F6
MDDALFPLTVEDIGLPAFVPAERREMNAGATGLEGLGEIRQHVQSRWDIGSFTGVANRCARGFSVGHAQG